MRPGAGAGSLLAGVVVASLSVSPSAAWAQESLRLEEVVASALATHPAVEAGRARASALAAGARAAGGEWWPAFGATAHATRFQEPMVVAPLHAIDPLNPPVFDRTLLQGHLSMEWLLFDGGQRRATVGGARRLAEAGAAALDAARDGVVLEAVSSYLAVLTSAALVAAHELQLEALESELGRAEQMYAEGSAPRVHVLRTEAALSRALAELEGAREARELALQRLARVSGLDPARVRAARLLAVAPADSEPPERAELMAAARSAHPAVEQAERRAAAARLAHEATRSTWLPRVSMVGRYSAYGSGAGDWSPEWQVGTQASYALFSGGARARRVEQAAAERAAAQAELGLVVRGVEDAVDGALAAYRSALSRARALEAAVTQSEEVARIEALALESGAGVQTDYLRAEAELLAARASLAEARHGAVEARVRLARATGRLDPALLGDLLVEVER
jgi:outer membrane protein TolC